MGREEAKNRISSRKSRFRQVRSQWAGQAVTSEKLDCAPLKEKARNRLRILRAGSG